MRATRKKINFIPAETSIKAARTFNYLKLMFFHCGWSQMMGEKNNYV